MRDTLAQIDEWEARHKAERATYERLKVKFRDEEQKKAEP
jgi:hypothetical protein